jgi:hypothetical protein
LTPLTDAFQRAEAALNHLQLLNPNVKLRAVTTSIQTPLEDSFLDRVKEHDIVVVSNSYDVDFLVMHSGVFQALTLFIVQLG